MGASPLGLPLSTGPLIIITNQCDADHSHADSPAESGGQCTWSSTAVVLAGALPAQEPAITRVSSRAWTTTTQPSGIRATIGAATTSPPSMEA